MAKQIQVFLQTRSYNPGIVSLHCTLTAKTIEQSTAVFYLIAIKLFNYVFDYKFIKNNNNILNFINLWNKSKQMHLFKFHKLCPSHQTDIS